MMAIKKAAGSALCNITVRKVTSKDLDNINEDSSALILFYFLVLSLE